MLFKYNITRACLILAGRQESRERKGKILLPGIKKLALTYFLVLRISEKNRQI
jgi:hypothetical protein